MANVLIVAYLLIVLALIAVILLQRSEGGALGIGGGGGGFMTARGSANLLTRTTAILATLFFATAIGLTILVRAGSRYVRAFLSARPPPRTARRRPACSTRSIPCRAALPATFRSAPRRSSRLRLRLPAPIRYRPRTAAARAPVAPEATADLPVPETPVAPATN